MVKDPDSQLTVNETKLHVWITPLSPQKSTFELPPPSQRKIKSEASNSGEGSRRYPWVSARLEAGGLERIKEDNTANQPAAIMNQSGEVGVSAGGDLDKTFLGDHDSSLSQASETLIYSSSPSQKSFAIPVSSQSSSHYEFTVIPGFFYQSTLSHDRNPSHVPKTILESFGLIDTSPDKWIKFKSRMAELNRRANSGESYKFLFCGRHGQGYHNLAEEKYGPDAWNEKWSKMTGDGKIRWDDADLTEMGMAQALEISDRWRRNLAIGCPLPELFLTSPLSRAAQTLELTFGDLVHSSRKPNIIVRERLREHNGVHPCDRRRSKTCIKERFPQFEIETGFTEKDELWDPNVREEEEDIFDRVSGEMQQIFADYQEKTYISITAHSGSLRSVLRALNHPPIALGTGEMVPIVVRVKRA